MRRITLLLVLMCLASAAMAQSRYIVYKCSGDVSVNRFRTEMDVLIFKVEMESTFFRKRQLYKGKNI